MSSLWDYWMSTESSLERTLQLPKEPARLLSLQLIFSVLVLFLQLRTSLQSRPCLCCPTWWGTPLCSNAEKSVGPQPKTVSSSSWWLMMLSAGDHGMLPVLPVGIKTITWEFQRGIVAAVGFAAVSFAMGSASRHCLEMLGLRSLTCPGQAQPVGSTAAKRGWVALSTNRAESGCSLVCQRVPELWAQGLVTAKKASLSRGLAVGLTSP